MSLCRPARLLSCLCMCLDVFLDADGVSFWVCWLFLFAFCEVSKILRKGLPWSSEVGRLCQWKIRSRHREQLPQVLCWGGSICLWHRWDGAWWAHGACRCRPVGGSWEERVPWCLDVPPTRVFFGKAAHCWGCGTFAWRWCGTVFWEGLGEGANRAALASWRVHHWRVARSNWPRVPAREPPWSHGDTRR